MFIYYFTFFVGGPIDGVEWEDIVTKVPNTLIEVGCKE
jgi:hypothetical protein